MSTGWPGGDQAGAARPICVNDRNHQHCLDPPDGQAALLAFVLATGKGECASVKGPDGLKKAQPVLAPVGLILGRIPFELHVV